jgi:hypothetical protein
MNDKVWVQMRFDPRQMVNVDDMISVMQSDPMIKLTDDQWEDTKECCADVMEQFLDLRSEAADLERNLHFYIRKHNDLETHFLRTYGREAYLEFMDEMDEHHARYARENKPAYKTHMWIKGNK